MTAAELVLEESREEEATATRPRFMISGSTLTCGRASNRSKTVVRLAVGQTGNGPVADADVVAKCA